MAERRQQTIIFGGKKKKKSGVYVAKRKAEEGKFSQWKTSDSKNFIFKLAKNENQ